MPKGPLRSDITIEHGLWAGSDRSPRWRIYDQDGELVSDFTNYEITFYLLSKGYASRNEALLTYSSVDGDISLAGPPWAVLSMPSSDAAWAAMPGGEYDYLLWRTDAGNVRPLAYGSCTVLSSAPA